MNNEEIAKKLEIAYNLFRNEGASLNYKNINNELLDLNKNNIQITLNLAIHYLYIDDLFFFERAYSNLNDESKLCIFNQLFHAGELTEKSNICKIIMKGLYNKDYIAALIRLASHGDHELTIKCLKEDSHTQNQIKNNIDVLEVVANSYLKLDRQNEAMHYLKMVLSLDPKHYVSRYNLALTYENIGEFEQAKLLFKTNFKHHNHTQSLTRLLSIECKEKLPQLLRTCENIIKKSELSKGELTDLYFSMGTAFDKLAEFGRAFEYFKLANNLVPVSETANDPIYLMEEQHKISYQLQRDESPVFICGMFRSGSTLIEQIVSAHSQFDSGGEIEFFTAETLNSCIKSNNYANELANAYEKKMSLYGGGINRVINKLPDNVLYIGLIKALFPNAKFIITQRSIEDTCLSIYFQNIANNYPYASNLELTKAYYLKQQTVVKHWQSKFNDDILTFKYEDLISYTEQSLKTLCQFLEIEFEKDMLNFYKNTNSIRTASYHQVRSKLHSGSVGRFKNYKHFLSDIF
ncbi:MAG: tetratricopeptide repeat-containing sulfotransferase family protein [Cognaticolwellia aestuarii]